LCPYCEQQKVRKFNFPSTFGRKAGNSLAGGYFLGIYSFENRLIGRQQKTRRSGFFQDHPNILSAALRAMVDRP
jgi:hypothetical protein